MTHSHSAVLHTWIAHDCSTLLDCGDNARLLFFMVLKFTAVCLVIFAIMTFLRFVQDSPVRSWKTVFFVGIPLSAIVCYYVSCAFPPPPPPQPVSEKVAVRRAELQRTFRHIEGVDNAIIDGSFIRINFAQNKPIQELKNIARSTGATAAHFLQTEGTNRIVLLITVQGRDRYRMEYETGRGIVDEKEF
jgi:hypothetical protein